LPSLATQVTSKNAKVNVNKYKKNASTLCALEQEIANVHKNCLSLSPANSSQFTLEVRGTTKDCKRKQ